jgi:apolipoprotein N-acyltransferase
MREINNRLPKSNYEEEKTEVKLIDPNIEQNEVVNPNFSTEKTFYTKYGELPLLLSFLFLAGLNLFLEIN